jgi:hypothetical protein
MWSSALAENNVARFSFLHKAAMLMVSITRKERIVYIFWAREGRKFSPLSENAVANLQWYIGENYRLGSARF